MWCVRNKSAGVSRAPRADNTIVRSIAECDYKSRHLAQNRPLRQFVAARNDRAFIYESNPPRNMIPLNLPSFPIYIETCNIKNPNEEYKHT